MGVIILTGANHGGDVNKEAFCSGGDQSVRGNGGYVGEDRIPRLNVLDLQHLIRITPKPVIAMVNGYAIGGGHVLHIVCDLSIASENAKFGQTGPRVGSFDAGYGAGYLARLVGHKKAREIWFLCRQYTAQEALDMGLVNTVVPFDQLEEETVKWCEEILQLSPMALRFLKHPSTLIPTVLPVYNSSVATQLSCSTPPTKRKKVATRSKKNVNLISNNSLNSLDRRTF